MPPTPPPDVDVEAWDATLDEIERRAPERLALIHFGVFDDVDRHLARAPRAAPPLRGAGRRRGDARTSSSPQAHSELGDDVAGVRERLPALQDYQGLTRYWAKRRAAEAA